jgi:hypothetical protein
MPAISLIFATFGMALLVLLATNTFHGRPLLKRMEPILAVISVMFVFLALQTATSIGPTGTPALAAPSSGPIAELAQRCLAQAQSRQLC